MAAVVQSKSNLSLSQHSFARASPSRLSISSKSSGVNSFEEDEDYTVTGKHALRNGKQRSQDDLRLLAVSAQITEISYSISDIQTRIFEIQELRHQAQSQAQPSTSNGTSSSTAVIDQALINLDERLEAVSRSVTIVEESLEPILRAVKTPTQCKSEEDEADAVLLRKHGALMAEWEAVQTEAEVLRDELKEDKWLAVFRTVSEQADGMMSSLEKAVTQCQDFIWQFNRRMPSEDSHSISSSQASSMRSEHSPVNLEVFTGLHHSFEAKKKYYMPSITKVLSVLDKGVRDRITKNGECLRRHADMRSRWRNLRERINRIDNEMESVRKFLVGHDKESEVSDAASNASRATSKTSKSGKTGKTGSSFLSTPLSSRSRGSSATSTIARSVSPLRRFANRITTAISSSSKVSSPAPTPPPKSASRPTPGSAPQPTLKHRSSFLPPPSAPETPERVRHRANQSLSATPASASFLLEDPSNALTVKAKKARWNSSTRIDPNESSAPPTIKQTPPRRHAPPSGQTVFNPTTPNRSNSPTSQGSSRPWSPVGTAVPTTQSRISPPGASRPGSRAGTHGRAQSPTLTSTIPRPRPQTPSHIPAPVLRSFGSDTSQASSDDVGHATTSLMQRALSPTQTASGASGSAVSTPSRVLKRQQSHSKIPVPTLNFNGPSRPGSPLSHQRSNSPTLSATSSSLPPRAQTPESQVRARAQQMPFYHGGSSSASRSRPAPSRGPPSSYRGDTTPRTPSRAGSYDRSNVFTPSLEQNPVLQYVPSNSKDPLDVEVARVVNGIAHGLLVERVDPPLKVTPHPGEEITAKYAVSNALSRKVITCRLAIINRSGGLRSGEAQTKKVMCRVGGGWQDLHMFLLNRQAGIA